MMDGFVGESCFNISFFYIFRNLNNQLMLNLYRKILKKQGDDSKPDKYF